MTAKPPKDPGLGAFDYTIKGKVTQVTTEKEGNANRVRISFTEDFIILEPKVKPFKEGMLVAVKATIKNVTTRAKAAAKAAGAYK